jgi:hypothetical protein
MNPRMLSLAIVLLMTGLPAGGGVVLRQVQVIETNGGKAGGRQVSETWAEGSKSKTVFDESADPMIPAGAYLLAPGGDAVYLVNPAEKTIARMDTAEMEAVGQNGQQTAGEQAETTGHGTEVADVKLEQQLDEPGPAMLGFPTRHYRYELSYTKRQSIDDMPGTLNTTIRETHEFWATDALNDDPAIAAIRAEPHADAAKDNAQPEVEDAGTRMYAHGLFLKHILERTATSDTGGATGPQTTPGVNEPSRQVITREVTELHRVPLAAAEFERPKGYTEIEFFTPGTGDAPE